MDNSNEICVKECFEIWNLNIREYCLKLSGEALAGDKKIGLDYDVITSFGKSIKKCVDAGVEVGIVVGGGNFWRGRSSGAMDKNKSRPYRYATRNCYERTCCCGRP